jgi:hypothetical protein
MQDNQHNYVNQSLKNEPNLKTILIEDAKENKLAFVCPHCFKLIRTKLLNKSQQIAMLSDVLSAKNIKCTICNNQIDFDLTVITNSNHIEKNRANKRDNTEKELNEKMDSLSKTQVNIISLFTDIFILTVSLLFGYLIINWYLPFINFDNLIGNTIISIFITALVISVFKIIFIRIVGMIMSAIYEKTKYIMLIVFMRILSRSSENPKITLLVGGLLGIYISNYFQVM